MSSDVSSSVSEMELEAVKDKFNRRKSAPEKVICDKSYVSDRRVSMISSTVSNGPPSFRRRSTLKGITQSITSMLHLRRLTLNKIKVGDLKPKIRYENTYKLSPDQGKHFPINTIEQEAEEIMRTEIGTRDYHEITCSKMALDLSTQIKNKVKEMNLPRYKIVCQVVIGQVKDQGIQAASRSVWEPTTDSYACVSYKNETIFATAMIYGIYFA